MGHLNAANEERGLRPGVRFVPDATASYVEKMASPLAAA
jgi:hypothetical protein